MSLLNTFIHDDIHDFIYDVKTRKTNFKDFEEFKYFFLYSKIEDRILVFTFHNFEAIFSLEPGILRHHHQRHQLMSKPSNKYRFSILTSCSFLATQSGVLFTQFSNILSVLISFHNLPFFHDSK